MNIGDTDADGWTYVRFGDAAKAAQEGMHEVQCEAECQFGSKRWFMHDDETAFFDANKYRIRVKARTITVTIPRPTNATWDTSRGEEPYVKLYFKAGAPVLDICLALNNTIREQS